jgi:hypothetical protein
MNIPVLVRSLVAFQLRVTARSIEDATTFDELGMMPLDLVLVVLRLESFDRGAGDFPLAALDEAKTVGDLVALVERWIRGDTAPSVRLSGGVSCA